MHTCILDTSHAGIVNALNVRVSVRMCVCVCYSMLHTHTHTHTQTADFILHLTNRCELALLNRNVTAENTSGENMFYHMQNT
jgi:uncharacterized radical SAM superfamily Fe-S cluster-containing enzyme